MFQGDPIETAIIVAIMGPSENIENNYNNHIHVQCKKEQCSKYISE